MLKAKNSHYNKLHFIKVVGQAAQIIIKKDKKILNLQDFRKIAKDVYKIDTLIKARSLKRMMSTDIAKNMLNQELIRIYNEIGYDESKYKEIMKMSIDAVIEKKDVTNALKIAEKYEKTHSLVQSSPASSKLQQNNQFNFNQYREETAKNEENQVNEQPKGGASDTETNKE